MSSCAMDDYLGAYVLAALEPDETEAVRAHVSGCAHCAAEVAALEGTVCRLAVLTLTDVEQALNYPPVRTELGTPRPLGRPRRPPYRLALAAAACVAAAGVGGGMALTSAPPAPRIAAAVQGVDAATQVSATLTVVPGRSATALHLSMTGAYPGGVCWLVMHGRGGRTQTTAGWAATARGNADVTARTSIPADQLQTFDVVTASGKRLIHLVMPPPAH